ncbi:ETC complex I subunit conserved region-domain-containing protein [Pseudomassariella vexata]|uniref:ETC complex I subunit conserved region-domain-containing protein n=1 Tax=Pseudomassariella vexata TaxID=1141098 RepID=A0A1Y2DFW5_9PEZI|nr:ETC complex I subunit conserved region-domain-containing protein [Pseudomassariella vexata]ORY58180.1 ETC complex I subunit conserved region-domain-containing protein [Pseudomassariella vexata]
MRRTLRLLANVKPVRYLEAGNPTGLTGLYTHSSPRSSLLFLYSKTLDKLKEAPESSLYRQSVEAVTKHRMAIVAAQEPPGYKEWQEKAKKMLSDQPESFKLSSNANIDGGKSNIVYQNGQAFMIRHTPSEKDSRYEEWDGELDEGGELEGLRSEEEREDLENLFNRQPLELSDKVRWDPEPQMTADQVEEIETKIGAGLIEEIVQVAKSELHLANIMMQAKPWENLEEKPVEGQWTYFDRNAA